MLFNSYEFSLLFLPLTLGLFYGIAKYVGYRAAASWLGIASLFFYAYWAPRFLPLLLISIVANYLAGGVIGKSREAMPRRSKAMLAIAIAANLATLAYFKYADLFISSFNATTGWQIQLLSVVLPIGISFFTFTQIAFLVDTYRGIAREYDFVHYLLFVTYFPHLIAGPVLHHKEMMPQFREPTTYAPRASNLATGLAIFGIGLAKKVLLADTFADYANPVFNAAGIGKTPDLLVAWIGVISYTLQIYFDFSGYSDMAIGLSKMFGVDLPLNFSSPYKSTSIVEFWRRWHMTLSRFLRDYLYVAMGGNRHGVVRRHANLLITMLLGGLWHGANWTFVVWGGLHGAFLVANHTWRAALNRAGWPAAQAGLARRLLGWAITLSAVMIAWVFFRAASFDAALRVLRGMTDWDTARQLLSHGWPSFDSTFFGYPVPIDDWRRVVCKLIAGGGVALFLPNTQSLPIRYLTGGRSSYVTIGFGLVTVFMLLAMNASRGASEFIYFNF